MRIGIKVGLVVLFLFNGIGVFGQEDVMDSFVPKLMPAKGHSDGIVKVKYSPGGMQLATASFDGTAKVWDTKSGHLILDIDSHNGEITSFDYSPDGKYITTASLDGTVKIWDLTTGSLVHDLNENIGWVYSANYSPDGKCIIICSDSTAIIWDLKTGQEKYRFADPEGGIHKAQYSPDGKYIVSAGASGRLQVMDSNSGQLIHDLVHDYKSIEAVKYSPDGSYILAIRNSPSQRRGMFITKIYIWNSKTGKLIFRSDPYIGYFSYGNFSPDGDKIIVPINDTISRIYNFLESKVVFDIIGHKGRVVNSFYSRDGKYIYTAGNYKINIWNSDSKKLIKKIEANEFYFGSSYSFSPNNENIALVDGNSVILMNGQTGKIIQKFKGRTGGILKIIYSPDRSKVVTLGFYNNCVLWDGIKGKIIWQAKLDHVYSENPLFTSDSKSLLIRGKNNSAELINANTGKTIQYYKGHLNKINSLSFSPSEATILTSSRDGSSKLWDRKSGKVIHDFKGHSNVVTSASFSPNGSKVLTSSKDSTVKLWDTNSGYMTHNLKGYPSGVKHAEFSTNGKYVLTISQDSLIKVWDVESMSILDFNHNSEKFGYASFGSNGNTIITSGSENQTKVWSLETKNLIHNFKGSIGNSNYLSPDRENIILFDDDLNEMIFDTKTGQKKFVLKKEKNRWNHRVEFSSDGKYLIKVYSDCSIIIYNTQTGKPTFEINPSSLAWDIDMNVEDKILTLGLYNGSISIWSLETGENLMSIFTLEGLNWVLLNRSGLFDASIQAVKWIYYLVGTEIIELDQLKERYYEPGLYQKVMNGEPLRDVDAMKSLEMYPLINAALQENQIIVKLQVRNGGKGRVSLFINGKEVRENANPNQTDSFSIDLTQFNKFYRADTSNTISLRSWNEEGWLKSAPYDLEYKYTPKRKKGEGDSGNINLGGKKHNPELYGIIIGSSDYGGDKLDLKFADKDAAYMYQAISQSSKALFGVEKTHIKYLSTNTNDVALLASKKNIKEAFQSFTDAKPEDILFIYLSGHGMSYENQFYYLTKDVSSANGINDPGIRENYTISSNELTDWITNIPAQKQVLVIDACSSGTFIEDLSQEREISSDQIRALDRMKDRTGMFVLAGSASDKVSYEASQYGQGVLTYSLLSGMRGQALRDNEFVDVSELFQFAKDEVPKLAADIGGIQSPSIFYPPDASSFDIGIVNDEVEIPLEDVKPVFELSDFEEEESWDDILKIGFALDEYLQDISHSDAKGIIFVPAKNVKSAYKLTGKYKVNEDTIQLRCRLIKEGDKKGQFSVEGSKNNIDILVEMIVDEVGKILNKR